MHSRVASNLSLISLLVVCIVSYTGHVTVMLCEPGR